MIDVFDIFCQPHAGQPTRTPVGNGWSVPTAVGTWNFLAMTETYPVIDGSQTATRPVVGVILTDRADKPVADYVMPATEAMMLALAFQTAGGAS